MGPVRSRPTPLSRPMPAPPAAPVAVSVPSGSPLGSFVWSMTREVPSPRDIPAKPGPLSNTLFVPRRKSRVTSFPRPRLNALPEDTRQSTPSRISLTGPIPSARTSLPLKGSWSASVPAPPATAVTWPDRI